MGGATERFLLFNLLSGFPSQALSKIHVTQHPKRSHVCACVQAAFLIPVSVCVYTTTGGLKATFLSSYIHTVIIYVALCIFAFTVYASGSDLGSPSKVSLIRHAAL